MMKIVSIDLETTGLDPATCQVLEFGAVFDDFLAPLESLPTFHRYLWHPKITGEPLALAMNAAIIQTIAEGKHPDIVRSGFTLLSDFTRWLDECYGEPRVRDVVVAGKNFAKFDLPFLKALEALVTERQRSDWGLNLDHRFHRRFLDPTMLCLDIYQDTVPPNLDKCLERVGLANRGEATHDAVGDALAVVKVLRSKLLSPPASAKVPV
jgi:DNA polymerase III epsilon subunit-like protein